MYCSSSQFVKNSGTGNAFTSHLVCKTERLRCHVMKNKGTSSFEVRTKTHYKVQFSSPQSISGSGRDNSLSLEKELKVQPLQFCDVLLFSCETLSSARYPVDSISLLNDGTLNDLHVRDFGP